MTVGKPSKSAKTLFPSALPPGMSIDYLPGKTIFSQGDECTAVHYVRQGVVKLVLVSKRGRSGVLGFLGRGDFFGEGCIGGRTNYDTSAIAVVASTVLVIDRKKMIQIIEKEPHVCTQFINYLLSRNHRIEQDLIDHLFNSSEKRLARALLLLTEYERGNENLSIIQRVNQDTLAEMVGTTRPRVNFFMNKFRKLKYIHYDHNGGLVVYPSLSKIL
jgi:CRP/FNR family transcriptional regulator, cyclic AMP receptor protein